jgi:hypothetical protein
MTLTLDKTEELTRIVDEFLKEITHQTLVDQSKVLDFTLDIRNILNSKDANV